MKKFISLFITISIVLGILGAFSVFAEEMAADLEISTLAELEAFRDAVNGGNTYEGKTVKLTADIDMSGKYGEGRESWEPIGRSKVVNSENNALRLVYKNDSYPYYEIKDVFAKDGERNTLASIHANTEFTAYAYLEQIAVLEGTNYSIIILAAYDERGTLIDVGAEEINPEYLPCSYTVPMCSEERPVGSIKAFIWDGVNSMIPLAETKDRVFAEQ